MRRLEFRIRRIIVGAATALLFMVIGTSDAGAEILPVRAGEHDSFSRIVVDLAAPADWKLGRDGDGYVLKLEPEDVEFDLSRIYRMIPRDRIADLGQTGAGTLRFTLGCDCHAKAFVTAGGSVVVDIADGPPRAASPFEKPIAPLPPQEETARLSPHPDSVEPDSTVPWRPPSTRFGQAIPDPRLALFWRGVAPSPAAQTRAGEAPADAAFEGDPAQIFTPAPDVTPEPIPYKMAAESDAPAGTSAEPPMLSVPDVPDPRVTSARNDLLEQLGRAAAQGLIEVDHDRLRLPVHDSGVETASDPAASEGTEDEGSVIHSETSVDRDSKLTVTRAPVTATGGRCIDGDALDIGMWGDARPVSQQIAERRAPLVGEFDKPSSDAVQSLVRLYLFLGFGAEARAVLSAFGVQDDLTVPLQEIGLILDGYEVGNSGILPGMTDCDTSAAMWAVLASRDLPPGTDIAEGAILRAFSALPPHLRQHLGPGLSRRLLTVGATSSARAIRDAVARIPGDGGVALGMMDGRLHLAKGDVHEAEALLDPIAAGNDPLAIEALILSIETRLDRNEAVDPAMADAAAALAYERQNGSDGPVLARLHILARGASGDFGAAFEALHRWPETAPDDLRRDTITRLFWMLTKTTDEAPFLTTYFRERDLLTSVTDDALLIGLAARLSDAGFAGEVRSLLAGDAGGTEAGRILLAKAALAEFDPRLALVGVAGLQGQEALNIRARAFAMGGDHLAAADSLEALGKAEPAALAAWRGGDWAGAAGAAPDAIRHAIRDFGLAPEDAAPLAEPSHAENTEPDLPGELAQGRALLADSQTVRIRLGDLLSATAEDGQ